LEVAVEKVGSEAARRRLPALLEQAHQGRASVIMKRGKPYAVLASLEQCCITATGAGLLALRGSGQGLWGKTPSVAVAAMRDEWP